MTKVGMSWIGAVALAAVACAGSARSAKSAPGGSGGTTMATAAETSGETRPSTVVSAPRDATSANDTKEIEGRVELIDRANNVTLAGTESVGHAFHRLKIDEDTEITVDGQQATLNEVHPGDEVRASFSGEGDELRVEKLEVVSSGE